MRANSVTYRRRCPEATVFTTIRFDPQTRQPNLLIVSAGKAGSHLNAAADWGARLAGAALRAGTSPERIADITEGIGHESSNGHHEAASLADAVAQSLRAFAESPAYIRRTESAASSGGSGAARPEPQVQSAESKS